LCFSPAGCKRFIKCHSKLKAFQIARDKKKQSPADYIIVLYKQPLKQDEMIGKMRLIVIIIFDYTKLILLNSDNK
jgi:hypothetical protein